MKNNFTKMRIKAVLRKYFDLRYDKDDEMLVLNEIRQGVSFRGANLWILILAIFVASLGLNVNSTAVIIGALLISPLMGPILGVGFAVGTIDMELLKRSCKNYLIATGISILTATVYWFISPFDEPQSELIARTAPTLYDVLIAFCGGAAGVIATCSKQKSNVVPGVAIATALMPPLCTAGYGLGTGQLQFFFGAFYLYFINSVFICMATILGVRFMKFKQKLDINKQHFSKIRNKFLLIIAITLVPALVMTINIVQDSLLRSNLNRFIHDNFTSASNKIISNEINKKTHTIRLVSIGKEITASEINKAKSSLNDYKLGKYSLELLQGTQTDTLIAMDEHNIALNKHITELETELDKYKRLETLNNDLSNEIKVLFPDIKTVSLSLTTTANTADTANKKNVMAVLTSDKNVHITNEEKSKILQWLQARTNEKDITLFITE